MARSSRGVARTSDMYPVWGHILSPLGGGGMKQIFKRLMIFYRDFLSWDWALLKSLLPTERINFALNCLYYYFKKYKPYFNMPRSIDWSIQSDAKWIDGLAETFHRHFYCKKYQTNLMLKPMHPCFQAFVEMALHIHKDYR